MINTDGEACSQQLGEYLILADNRKRFVDTRRPERRDGSDG